MTFQVTKDGVTWSVRSSLDRPPVVLAVRQPVRLSPFTPWRSAMRFVVFWAVLLFSLPTQAQEVMDGPGGQPGLWFPVEEARVAVLCLGDLQASRAQVGLLGQSLTLADAHTAALTAEVEGLGRSLGELERNLADAGAWWSPILGASWAWWCRVGS